MFVGSGFSLLYLYSVHLELEWSGRIRQPGSQACVSRRTGKQGPVEAYWGPAVGQCHSTAPCTAPCTAHLRTCQRCISGCGLGVGPLRGRCKRRDGQMGRWADAGGVDWLAVWMSDWLPVWLPGVTLAAQEELGACERGAGWSENREPCAAPETAYQPTSSCAGAPAGEVIEFTVITDKL